MAEPSIRQPYHAILDRTVRIRTFEMCFRSTSFAKLFRLLLYQCLDNFCCDSYYLVPSHHDSDMCLHTSCCCYCCCYGCRYCFNSIYLLSYHHDSDLLLLLFLWLLLCLLLLFFLQGDYPLLCNLND